MRKSHSRACARVWNYGRSYNSPDTVVRDRTSIAQPYACVVYLSSVWYVVRAYIRRIYAVSVYYVYPRAVLYICVGNKIRMYVIISHLNYGRYGVLYYWYWEPRKVARQNGMVMVSRDVTR